RGGRVGQQSFILDGLGVKNQLDASTGGLGLRIPPDILTEASLVTNGFSARYGQAISGLINVVTKDGGERWQGRAAYETDRPLWGAADMGLDRVVLSGDGPLLGGVRIAAALDAEARLDADPVNAPAPTDPRHPLTADLRVGWFDREFFQGVLTEQPDYRFGAFSWNGMPFLGIGVAEPQDTAAARSALPGFVAPEFSVRTPWGVPAFFVGTGSRG